MHAYPPGCSVWNQKCHVVIPGLEGSAAEHGGGQHARCPVTGTGVPNSACKIPLCQACSLAIPAGSASAPCFSPLLAALLHPIYSGIYPDVLLVSLLR